MQVIDKIEMSSPRYRCCYGACLRQGPKNIKKMQTCSLQDSFVRFPSPIRERAKCERWIEACGRSFITLADITKSSQLCARHFHGFCGPTVENPDPVPLVDVLSPDIIKTQVNPPSESRNHTLETVFDLKTITPQIGWALEVFEKRVTFRKILKGSAIIECTITNNKEVSVISLEKCMNLSGIYPNFVLNDNGDIYELLRKLKKFNVCIGNEEKNLIDSFNKKRKSKQNRKGYYCDKVQAIFSEDCDRLIPATRKRCYPCGRYRRRLREIRHSTISNHVSQKKKRRTSVLKKHITMSSNCEKTKAAILSMKKIFEDKLKMEPTGSFTAVFLRQQLKAMHRSKYGMRWDKTFLKWCCYLKNKSKSAYEVLRKSGCIYLPSTRTLYNEQHIVTSKTGFHKEKFAEMMKTTNILNRPAWDRYFVILLDEMKIKEDLMCHKNNGFLTGFKDINYDMNTLDEKKRAVIGNETPPLATQVLQLMLRGITNDIKIPFAHFATTGTSSTEIYSLMQEAVEKLENCGFRILGVVGDGCSSNRKYFKMCAESAAQISEDGTPITFYAPNLFANDEERNIYFISDAPHLIKTTRNCFSNSVKDSKIRNMWKNNENISWSVILKLYYYQLRRKGEFKHVSKLSYAHVFLNSYAKMKVNYAVQVLSETVASAIEHCFGHNTYPETVNFIRIFNKFFDICNVKNCKDGLQKRKKDKVPFTSINDERLKWLEEDFIQYLDDWEEDVFNRPGKFSAIQKAKMLLSKETIEGLKMTAKSTVAIVKFLLKKGAPYILTQHLNQDPLEQYFGRMRAAGGRNSNPSVWLYQSNIDKLESLKGFVLEALGGNTEIDKGVN